MVHLRSSHRRIADTGSCMQHSMGSSSRDGHKGSCHPEGVARGRIVEVVRLGYLLVAAPEKLGWACCVHFLHHQLLRNETALVDLRSVGIEKPPQLEGHCIH